MKEYKYVTKEFTEVKNVLQLIYVCDICKSEQIVEKVRDERYPVLARLSTGPDVAPFPMVTICTNTNSLPEGNVYSGESYFICLDCYEKHIKPLLGVSK